MHYRLSAMVPTVVLSLSLLSFPSGCDNSKDAAPEASQPCASGDTPPVCYPQCGSDDTETRSCVDGAWSSPAACRDTPCPIGGDPSCEEYNGEVCCSNDGTEVFAVCSSPTQPYCLDGSDPRTSCDPVLVTVEGINSPCGDPEAAFTGTTTLKLSVTNRTVDALTLESFRSEGETMTFDVPEVAAGETARFGCERSPAASSGQWPRPVTATVFFDGGKSVEVAGETELRQQFDFCDTAGAPDFVCRKEDCDEGDSPPTCFPECGSDVTETRVCEDGTWSSPASCRDTPCPASGQPSCELYFGEVCCGTGGTEVFARCPSPSEPFCEDGTEPRASCDAVVSMTLAVVNSPCGNAEAAFTGTMTFNVSITNGTADAVALDRLTSGDDTMSFTAAEVAAGATARFKCKRSPAAPSGDWPRSVSATLHLQGGATVNGTGEASLVHLMDFCDTAGEPDFACTPVTEF